MCKVLFAAAQEVRFAYMNVLSENWLPKSKFMNDSEYTYK